MNMGNKKNKFVRNKCEEVYTPAYNIISIVGDEYRNYEVINILQTIYGKIIQFKNIDTCTSSKRAYYINVNDGSLQWYYVNATNNKPNVFVYTIDEFYTRYDKVSIEPGDAEGITDMKWDGTTMWYKTNMSEGWVDEINFITDSYAKRKCDSKKISTIKLDPDNYTDIVEIDLGYYEIEIKGEKAYAISKKPKYPETYEECCKLLGLEESVVDGCIGYDYKAFGALQKLILCRDAYWKVDEWAPDWTIYCEDTRKYTIERNQDKLSRSVSYVENCIFAFPTEESRDKFFENFKDLIEKCKHLI
jgi:hypothetical protein